MKCSLTRDGFNKPLPLTMEYYRAVKRKKKNEDGLTELMWNNFKDKLLNNGE